MWSIAHLGFYYSKKFIILVIFIMMRQISFLKRRSRFFKKNAISHGIFLSLCCQPLLLLVICTCTRYLYEDYRTTLGWIPWCFFLGILIFVSCYLGTLCGIISLIYIFKDKIRESLENFFQKREERKEKSKKQKKD